MTIIISERIMNLAGGRKTQEELKWGGRNGSDVDEESVFEVDKK